MSTGTNRERIEQNNTLLEGIKTQIQNLPEAGGSGDIKQFATQEEMQADTTAQEGDLAIVYSSTFNDLVVGETYDTLYCPKTITLDTAITSTTNIWFSSGTNIRTATHWVGLTASVIQFYTRNGFTGTSMSTVAYSSSDGITYTRTDTLAEVLTVAEIFENKYSTITVQTGNYDILQQMFRAKSNYFGGLYKYGDSSWSLASTQLTAIADYVYEKEFYGKNGVEIGTLTQDISNSFTDMNAEVYGKIQNYYDNLEPRVLTDSDKTIDKSIRYIPTKSDGTPLLNTSSVTNMRYVFKRCTNLTTIPLLDTSSVTDMYGMFQDCTNLTTIPLLNTSNVTNMNDMFVNCTNLTEIPQLDTSSVTDMSDMFRNCTSLSDESLNNILAMCTNATSYTNTKTLKYIGLTSEQATKCQSLSNWSTFTAAGWTTGY